MTYSNLIIPSRCFGKWAGAHSPPLTPPNSEPEWTAEMEPNYKQRQDITKGLLVEQYLQAACSSSTPDAISLG